jgi:eukaryotic-like serine/threonine-protein kinase
VSDEPDATGPTVMEPSAATEPTLVPTVPTAAVDADTVMPGSEVVRAAAARPPSQLKTTASRTVGAEMRAASIERFGTVGSDRFEVLDELARGGLGRVFRARDPRTNRIVAIKEVLKSHPEIIVRFAREAMVTANLQHPSIVPVYEVGRWQNGEPFYAMKLVAGRTLDQVIRETTTTDARIALVPHVIAVADALAYAHSERVIHRDLKPANILVGSYGEIVIDWGLAKNLATGEELEELPMASTLPPDNNETIAGSVVGTPAFMSPEQALGEAIDEHADVYAIGAILYTALTGVRPFVEIKDFQELMEAVVSRPPRPIAELAPGVPAELIAIVAKAMARAPADRYATAAGLAQDLRSFQAGKLVAAHHYTAGQLLRRWVIRHRAIVVTALIALIVLIAVGAASVWRIAKERDEAEAQRELARGEKVKAQEASALAEHRFADSLQELARQALATGAGDRALTLLAGVSRAETTPAFEILVAQARKSFAGLEAIAPAQLSGTTSAQLSDDGKRLYMVASNGSAQGWDFASGRAIWAADDVGAMMLSPDGHMLVAVLASGELAVRAADTGAVIAKWPATSGDAQHRPTLLRWTPDSAHFAAITPTGHVLLGEPTGAALRELEPHAKAVTDLAMAPDGHAFATAGADGVTFIRDASTGATIAKLVDRTAPPVGGAADRGSAVVDGPAPLGCVSWIDNDRVVTGDDKGGVRIWQVGAKRVVQKLQQPDSVFGAIVGAGWLATYGIGAIVTVWELSTGTAIARLGGHQFAVDSATSDGTHLITTDEIGSVYVWDPLTGERLQSLPLEATTVVVAARAGRVVVYGGGRARVYRFTTDAALRHLVGHTGRVRDLQFSADSATLWSASNDNSARGDNLADGHVIVLGEAGYREPAVTTTTGPLLPPSPKGLRSLQLSHDGATIATAAEDGTLALWDAHTGARRGQLVGHSGRARRVVFTRDGRFAYSVGDTTLRRWDVAGGHELGKAGLGEAGWDVALFDNEQIVATMTDPKHARLWHASDLSPIGDDITNVLRDLTIVGDSLLVGSQTRIFLLGPDGVPLLQATEPTAYAVGVGPHTIAVSNVVRDLQLFDRATLAPIRSWLAPDVQLGVKLRPDGAILATASFHRVRLWDPATGTLLAETPEMPALVTQLAWSPDGRWLAFGGGSGTIYVWDLAPTDVATLGRFVKCVSPWQRDDAALVAATFEPASCGLLR